MGIAGKICRSDDSPLVVGVSGGVDSITLADMLYRQGIADFAVAHCNFRLRGEESDADAEFVRDWCETRGVKFHHIDFDTVGYARLRKVSIEMAARELRYGWFATLCKKHGYRSVAIAHNADDNAETLILNLVRGTGLRGICGMKETSVQNVAASPELAAAIGCSEEDFPETLNIRRPLLGMTRTQIEGYARRHGLRWREDRTNKDSAYKRNLIRNEIIPLLERLNPSAVKVLNRDMKHFTEVQAIVDDYFNGGDDTEDVESFAVESPADDSDRCDECSSDARLRDRIVLRSKGWRYALFLYLERYSFNSAVIGQIEELLDSGRTVSGKIFYSPTHCLVMTNSSFIIQPLDSGFSRGSDSPENHSASSDGPLTGDGSYSGSEGATVIVTGPGEFDFNGCHISVELLDRSGDFDVRQPAGVTAISADDLQFPLTLRTWRHSDWMRPIGCRGRKKISDLFTDLKFSLPQKRRAVFIESQGDAPNVPSNRQPACIVGAPGPDKDTATLRGHVLALLGLRVDESVRITSQTRRILRFYLR